MGVDATADRQRTAGAVLGGLIGIVPAGVGLLEPDMDVLVPAGAVGALSGALLGARYGARIRRVSRRSAAMVVARMAVLAVLIGDLIVCGAVALSATESGVSGFLFALVVLPVMGLAVVGVPALAMALGAAIAWAVAMRLLPRGWMGEPA